MKAFPLAAKGAEHGCHGGIILRGSAREFAPVVVAEGGMNDGIVGPSGISKACRVGKVHDGTGPHGLKLCGFIGGPRETGHMVACYDVALGNGPADVARRSRYEYVHLRSPDCELGPASKHNGRACGLFFRSCKRKGSFPQ